jgi:RHS repeat-associated protein
LVDKETQEVLHYESLNPFGDNLQDLNPISPWIFATKHFDSDIGLIDFGDRQYDPSIKQWTSAESDPRVFEEDLYLYCNNDPLKYIDPNGQWSLSLNAVLQCARTGWAIGGPWGAVGGALIGIGLGIGLGVGLEKVLKNVDEKLNNGPQGKQFRDAIAEIERKTGKKVTKDKKRELHDRITGKGYGYHDIVNEGIHFFV